MMAVVVAAALLLPGVPRHSLGEHCARVASVAGQHAGGHHTVPNNTPDHRSDPCPHCPPAQCATESGCASPILGALARPVAPPPIASTALPAQVATRLPPHSTQPPTPPPQVRFRIV